MGRRVLGGDSSVLCQLWMFFLLAKLFDKVPWGWCQQLAKMSQLNLTAFGGSGDAFDSVNGDVGYYGSGFSSFGTGGGSAGPTKAKQGGGCTAPDTNASAHMRCILG